LRDVGFGAFAHDARCLLLLLAGALGLCLVALLRLDGGFGVELLHQLDDVDARLVGELPAGSTARYRR